MGTYQHHAVVATTWKKEEILKVKKWIKKLDSEDKALFSFSKNNRGYFVICMGPDGSKESYERSLYCDDLRDKFISKLNNYWEFIHVSFGELGKGIVQ